MTQATDASVLRAVPADSDTAIVAFSARGTGSSRFHFFNIDEHLPGPAKLLLRDPSDRWYNAGLPGVGETVEEIADHIRGMLEELGVKRVITLGSSMGGYGAILFGCLIGAERTIALAPQTLLDPRIPVLVPPADTVLQAPDLAPFIRAAPATRVDVITPWTSPLDVFHAQRIADIPTTRILAVWDSGHGVVAELHNRGELWPLVTDLIEERIPAGCEEKEPFEPEAVRQLTKAMFALGRDRAAVKRAVRAIAESAPDWQWAQSPPPHLRYDDEPAAG